MRLFKRMCYRLWKHFPKRNARDVKPCWVGCYVTSLEEVT